MKDIIIEVDTITLLTVPLKKILTNIENIESINWRLLWLDATGNLKGKNILDLEADINKPSSCYTISYTDLIGLEEELHQLINLLLIGDKLLENILSYDIAKDNKYRCDYYFELVDSSYWEITSTDTLFITEVLNNIDTARYKI